MIAKHSTMVSEFWLGFHGSLEDSLTRQGEVKDLSLCVSQGGF